MDSHSDTVGNSAAMRDALEKLRAEIGLFYNNEWIPYDAWQGCDDMISHALSAPARNCDRFGTDNAEAELAYEEFCEKSETDESITGAFEWLLALAAERKGEGDGR